LAWKRYCSEHLSQLAKGVDLAFDREIPKWSNKRGRPEIGAWITLDRVMEKTVGEARIL